MNELFSQGGKGSTGILTNKQAIARKFGIKQSEVVYFSVGVVLSGYKAIYDKTTQKAYALPALASGTTAVSLSDTAQLVHSGGTVNLGDFSKERGIYDYTGHSFTDGFTVHTSNSLVTHEGISYYYVGTLPVTVAPGSNPKSDTNWVGLTNGKLQDDLVNGGLLDVTYAHTFPTVASMVAYPNHKVGISVRTLGYYVAGDGGGAEYIISSGSPLQDYSDAGSVVINASTFAKLIQKPSYDFKQFGVKPSDAASAESNDVFIAQAVTRSRFGFSEVIISDVIYHKKPIVLDYFNVIKGNAKISDATYTPRFIKVDNTTSGIPAMAYPGGYGNVTYDVDAGIIIKRQNASTDYVRGITIEGFLVQSASKSAYAIYAPHIADFSIKVGSRGFNCGIFWHVAFLGTFEGKHIGLGTESTDPTVAIGAFNSHFSTLLDGGNSVKFRLSLNGYNRAMQLDYFGNAVLDCATFENIRRVIPSAPTPIGLLATNSTVSGVLSCEGSSACLVRCASGSNVDINLSAVFHVTQDSDSEGIVHVLNGGRLTLRSTNITGDVANTKIINENGGYLDIAANCKFSNIDLSTGDFYRYKNRTISFAQTSGVTATSFTSGSEVTFAGLNGIPNAALSGGTIQFNSPALVKITVQARNLSSGSLTFGINGASTEAVSNGQQVSLVVGVNAGDVLNIKAASALTLGSIGGIRVLLEPVL